MYTRVSSQDFLNAWMNVVNLKRELLQADWRNAEAFTSLIKGCEDNIITSVGKLLELKAYTTDYYSVDSLLYSDEDLVPDIKPNSYWFRQVKVAFEHENHFNSGLYQEVSHLLLINSDLKVLVTYPSNRESTEQRQKEYLHQIINGTRIQKQLSEGESFLLIFGYENEFSWEAYVYKETGWKTLDCNTHNIGGCGAT
ncbi:hypothetical protein SAMN05444008_10574 [Cnuella takakiae]|uniref:Uncharacterized protein n=1 Tax=Cnuella takakiae TaxID=1302690 RepID=A0A1M4Z4E0_9BACT|nr:hypothetical protein [Cnuella takakiae]OLY94342.1 hypothetical protein BUE76_22485 [Cnuella takakiae]SHF12592.1 hypothetical protein SAMN05444008_10574 [Cnuella takakiae]